MKKYWENMMKRFLAVILAAALVAGLAPMTVFGAEETNSTAFAAEEEKPQADEQGEPQTEEQNAQAEMVTVTVESRGSGTVKLNGSETDSVTVEKGSQVGVELIPVDKGTAKTYIKELSAGEEIELPEKYKKYSGSIAADGNKQIHVVFMTEYKVTVSAGEGGKITLDGEELDTKKVDENGTVQIRAEANAGYQLMQVLVDGKEQPLSDTDSLQQNISVSKDIEIKALFVKVYTLTVNYNQEQGTVVTNPECTGGSVVVRKDSQLEITAAPKTGYRVSKVVKNGAVQNYTENDKTYTDTVGKADKDYTYEISFALNCYTVAVRIKGAETGGEVSYSGGSGNGSFQANLNSEPKLTLSQKKGYHVSALTVGGVDKMDSLEETAEGGFTVTLPAVTADTSVEVTFGKNETEEAGENPLEGDSYKIVLLDEKNSPVAVLRKYTEESNSQKVFVIPKGTKIKIEPQGEYTRVTLNGKGSSQETIEATGTQEIHTVTVGKGRLGNVTPKDITMNIKLAVDQDAPSVEIKPAQANTYGYYHADVPVAFTVTDEGVYSGIGKVEYRITSGGRETMPYTIAYAHDPSGESQPSYIGNITVSAENNDSDNVKVYLRVTDLAGNVYTMDEEDACSLKIRAGKPTGEVQFKADSPHREEEGRAYFGAARSASLVITDTADTFVEDITVNPTGGEKHYGMAVKVDAVDFNGNEVIFTGEDLKVAWTHSGDRHTAELTFSKDANYTLESFVYTNKADMSSGDIEIKGNFPSTFTVDTTRPVTSEQGDRENASWIGFEENIWSKLASALTFGAWSNGTVTVEAGGKDATSPIAAPIKYYKTDGDTSLKTAAELDQLYEEGEFTEVPCQVDQDEKFIVYAKIIDYAGNSVYISTEGIIRETKPGTVQAELVGGTNAYGYYNTDVKIRVDASDFQEEGALTSGIKTIDYTIKGEDKKGENKEKKGNLYTFKKGGEVLSEWDSETQDAYITVEAKEFCGENITVTVTAEDNAGNSFTGDELTVNICSEPPEVSVKFEDTANKTTAEGRGYFQNAREAVITVKDKAFCEDVTFGEEEAYGLTVNVKADVKGEKEDLDYSAMAGVWTHEGDSHTLKITFQEELNYTWSLSYKSKADLTCHTHDGDSCEDGSCKKAHVSYVGDTPQTFTVDRTDPFEGEVTVGEELWDKIVQTLTFGLYSNTEVTVAGTAQDSLSPVWLEYYISEDTRAKTVEELDKAAFTVFKDEESGDTYSPRMQFPLSPEKRFVCYMKATDYAGNYIYISSDGYILDAKPSIITLTPEPANASGLYNHDVKVAVKVSEPQPYSGIKSVSYEVRNQNKVTDSGSRQFGVENPEYRDLQAEYSDTIVVDAKENNSCNVVVTVNVEDNAGNKASAFVTLDIDVTKPAIAVSYDNNQDNGGNGYFNKNRTATVAITERAHHFDAAAATEGIVIRAVDSSGKTVKLNRNAMISAWTAKEGATPDDTVHTATVSYFADANYTVSISYTDKAGNSNDTVNTLGCQAPWKFTVDKLAPTGTVQAKSQEGREETWDELATMLAFGFRSGKKITVKGTAEDATSPVGSVLYYKTDRDKAMTEKELQEVTEWKNFRTVTVKPNEQFTIYVKITDLAGNVSYISSDGMIVDSRKPRVESVAPKVSITPEQPVNGIYSQNVKVTIQVQDPQSGNTYSGLKSVRYAVFNMGKKTQEGNLYQFTKEHPKRTQLKKSWTGKITVDSAKNNSNQVVIRVYAEDNAGNTSKGRKAIKIDTTAPKIVVSYNNNSPDSGKYYQNDRVATITVTERNFDPKDIVTTIRNTDGAVPALSAWREVKGTGNLDDTQHVAMLTYHADGDYTFDMNYTDLAGHKGQVSYTAGTANPTEFTIDQTVPTVSVSYDNNEAQNGKYFKEPRTGTVTITEHNFDESRVTFTQTASLRGGAVTAPSASWSSSGDVHTAVFSYEADGDYTFDVTMKDMAGNESGVASYGDSQAGQEFTVDTNIEKPKITGVENGKSYKGEVVPAISYSDVNFRDHKIRLLRTRKDEKNIDVTEEFLKKLEENSNGGQGISDAFFKKPENDGIYTLTVEVSDLAGNEEKEEVTFTVNRFGSVYVFDDYLISIKDVYTQGIEQGLVITEYNPDRLVEDSLKIQISRDGAPLNNVEYTVNPVVNDKVKVGQSGWYQYEYKIAPKNFEEDGIYRIAIASEDTAGNKPETINFEEGDVMFRIDTTPAEITSIRGLENAIVNAESQNIEFEVFDAIGLKKVTVYVDDKVAGSYDTFDEIVRFNNSLVVTEGMNQNVRLVIEDLAGNITDTDEKTADGQYAFQPGFEFSHQLTVSTNAFIRWYANRMLFWGTIGGVAAAAILLFLFLAVRKRRAPRV